MKLFIHNFIITSMSEQDLTRKTLEDERNIFRILCERIMGLSPKIRFVTIIDSHGRLMHGGQREGISNYLSPQTEKDSLRHTLETWKLRAKFSNQIGEGKYALAEYAKIKRITIPLDKDHLLYMTTEVSENHNDLIEEILKIKER